MGFNKIIQYKYEHKQCSVIYSIHNSITTSNKNTLTNRMLRISVTTRAKPICFSDKNILILVEPNAGWEM